MANDYFDGRHNPENQSGHPTEGMTNAYGSGLPYDDPAFINPDELATLPKQVKKDDLHHPHHHHHHHMKSTPVRDGRNITRTDNHPDKYGFM